MKTLFEYMIEMDLPVPFEDEFLSLIPRQRAIVNKLMNQGVITSYAVSVEKGKLWITMLGESETEVIRTIEEFPIIRHVLYKISWLAFHNSVGFQVPQFSVN